MDNLFNTFFETLATTSAVEATKITAKTNANVLADRLRNAKSSNLGTPVLDYVELTLYEDLSTTNNRDSVFASNRILSTVKNAVNEIKHQHGINVKTLHLNEVEVSVNQTFNIVRTAINGVNGTFKEFYNSGDFIITLNGSLTGLIAHQNDLQNLTNLSRLAFANKRFDIKSDFVNSTFGVNDVVMTDFSVTLNTDYSNVVDYTITLESDTDLEIIY